MAEISATTSSQYHPSYSSTNFRGSKALPWRILHLLQYMRQKLWSASSSLRHVKSDFFTIFNSWISFPLTIYDRFNVIIFSLGREFRKDNYKNWYKWYKSVYWFLCWFMLIKDQCLKTAFSLPPTIILNYTFSYNKFPSFSSFSVIHPQHNCFAPLCKIQRAKPCSQAANPQTAWLWCYYNFPPYMFVYFLTCRNFEFLNQTHWHNYFYLILCTLLCMSAGSQSNVCFLSSW